MRVALFVTCLADLMKPGVAFAAIRLLEHGGCTVEVPQTQTCCGQPAYNAGFHTEARDVAQHWLRVFAGAEYVVSPSASCVAMVRKHFAELLDEAQRAEAEQLAARTFEFSTFLTQVLRLDLATLLRFDEPTTFHYPCHARGILSAVELERCLGGAVTPPARRELCCGFGGTFAVDLPEISGAMARERLADLEATGARQVVCSEGGCTMQLAGTAHRDGRPLRFVHLAELLAASLGLLEPEA